MAIHFCSPIGIHRKKIRKQSGTIGNRITWAFSHYECNFYHPLTMISLVVDCQFHGLKPGGYHLTNVLIHAFAAIVLFLALRQMTSALWRSSFVATLFAIHPLSVEPVAWIAERKELLGGCFFMLTLLAYTRYVASLRSLFRYLTVVLSFVFGLMSKPSVVTLPFVLLLLDYWPLRRVGDLPVDVGPGPAPGYRFLISRRLVLEKIPLLALSATWCVLTVFGERDSLKDLPIPLRLSHALLSYVTYLRQIVWPEGLAVFYPHYENTLSLWQPALALVLLISISTGVFVCRRRHPYLVTGWLWYLGMLVPMIGLVPVGEFAHADRFAYLPQIGIYILVIWTAADALASWRKHRLIASVGAVITIALLVICARIQVSYWRNSESLWTHALACTSNNSIAENNLGRVLLQAGDSDKAEAHFQRALEINSRYADAYNNLGLAAAQTGNATQAIAYHRKALEINPNFAAAYTDLGVALARNGRRTESMACFQRALEVNPDFAAAHSDLGVVLAQIGRVDEAIVHFQRALEINPNDADTHNNLGYVLFNVGRADEAFSHFQRALEINFNDPGIHNNLGLAFLQKGESKRAMAEFEKALELNPRFVQAQRNLAWVLATSPEPSLRNGPRAIELAEEVDRLTGGNNPIYLDALAAAYAEAGRFDDAVRTTEKAIELAEAAEQEKLIQQFREQLKLYRSGQALREH